MPELSLLRPAGIQAPSLFTPNPGTYINPEALYSVMPKPVVSTVPLARAALVGSIVQGLGNLPNQLQTSYNQGYALGKARQLQNDPNSVTTYSSDGSFTTRPLSALDLTNLDASKENLAWEQYLHQNDPYSLYIQKTGGKGYASPGGGGSSAPPPISGGGASNGGSSVEPPLPQEPGPVSQQPSLDSIANGDGSVIPDSLKAPAAGAAPSGPLSSLSIPASSASAPTPSTDTGPLASFSPSAQSTATVSGTTPTAAVDSTGTTPQAGPDTPSVKALSPATAASGIPQPVQLPAQQMTPGGLIIRDPAYPGMMQVLRPGQKAEFVKDPAQFDGQVFNSIQDLRGYADGNGITYSKISGIPGTNKVVAQGISINPKLSKELQDRASRLNIDPTGMTPGQVLAAVSREEDRRSILDPEHEKALEGIEKDMRGDKQLQQAWNALDGLRKVNAVASGQPMNLAQAKEVLTGFANIENGAQTLGPKMASFFEKGQTLKSKLSQWSNNIANLLGQPGSSDQNMLDPKTLQDMQAVAKELAGERAQQVTVPALNQYYARAKRQGIPTQYIDESMTRYDTLKGDGAQSTPAAKPQLPAGGGTSPQTAYIVHSQSDYDALPPGSWYQDSNGKLARKPGGSVAAAGS